MRWGDEAVLDEAAIDEVADLFDAHEAVDGAAAAFAYAEEPPSADGVAATAYSEARKLLVFNNDKAGMASISAVPTFSTPATSAVATALAGAERSPSMLAVASIITLSAFTTWLADSSVTGVSAPSTLSSSSFTASRVTGGIIGGGLVGGEPGGVEGGDGALNVTCRGHTTRAVDTPQSSRRLASA